MNDSHAGDEPAATVEPAGEESLLALFSLLLRRRRFVMALTFLGAATGLAIGLLSTRMYTASATFIPQGTDNSMNGLAMAASQFGIRVPSTNTGWGASIYVDLLRSRALLEPIVLDTITVDEEKGRRTTLVDLLKTDAQAPEFRTELAVRKLRDIVTADEDKKRGAVNLTVKTAWPSVSYMVAQRLVRGVNLFNVDTRKSQAKAERLFVETRTTEAERALRDAEDKLQSFLQRNRVITPQSELAFDQDRLARVVALRQQVLSSLEQNREDARIREVRDIPVITVLDEPRLPVVGESRKLVLKVIAGGALGAMLGVILVFLGNALKVMRRERSAAAVEFFRLVYETSPAFLRRRFEAVKPWGSDP